MRALSRFPDRGRAVRAERICSARCPTADHRSCEADAHIAVRAFDRQGKWMRGTVAARSCRSLVGSRTALSLRLDDADHSGEAAAVEIGSADHVLLAARRLAAPATRARAKSLLMGSVKRHGENSRTCPQLRTLAATVSPAS
jgi:hypothetical protein